MLYKDINGLKYNQYTFTGLFNMLHTLGLDTWTSEYSFFTGLTASIIDDYLNTTLADRRLLRAFHDMAERVNGKWSLKHIFNMPALSNTLFVECDRVQKFDALLNAPFSNIMEYADIDNNEYGTRERNLDYDRVVVTFNGDKQKTTTELAKREITDDYGLQLTTNEYGEHKLTDTIGIRTDYHTTGDDTTTEQVAGFNSADFVNNKKTTFKEGNVTDTHYGIEDNGEKQPITDVHTNATVTDKIRKAGYEDKHTEKAVTDTVTEDPYHDETITTARQDTDTVQTYTDVLTHTRHYIIDPELYFNIKKEMADFCIYDAIREAVCKTLCSNEWGWC